TNAKPPQNQCKPMRTCDRDPDWDPDLLSRKNRGRAKRGPKILVYIYIYIYIGVRGSPERDISSLRALGPGGGQISRVVHVSTRAAFGVFAEKYGFVQEGHTFLEKREEIPA
ncbi:MAG: hypothetical protein QGE95_16290, partial [Arenicellales bacterium]|nr:hypothetical protein [Arenicellales bacterium]